MNRQLVDRMREKMAELQAEVIKEHFPEFVKYVEVEKKKTRR